jgi:hypothetical protein
VTNVDVVDFNDEAAMKRFVAKAIPLGASEQCARRVLSERKMKERYTTDRVYGEREMAFAESWTWTLRIKAWISIGYDKRSAYVALKNGKVIRRGAN